MIIYGSNSTRLKSEQSRTASCPNCRTKGSLVISIFSRHAHIFWIPLFPFGKKGVYQCLHCRHSMDSDGFTGELKQAYDELRAQTRPPIWQFAGLFVILSLAGYGVYANNQDKNEELAFLANPKAGDMYVYKTESGNYSTIRVMEAFTDSVYVSFNDYETDKLRGIDEIDADVHYPDEWYVLTNAELQEMYDTDEITDIRR